MLQAVLKELKHIDLENTQRRPLKDGEVRLKVISCAICGSDIRIYNYGNSRVKLPHVTGHEVVGEVIEKSNGCNLNIGDICCFGADLPCSDSKCEFCKHGDFSSCDTNYAIGYQFDGGFAEEMIIPENCWKHGAFCVIKQPYNDIKDLYKYSLVEPLACAIHGVEPMNVSSSDRVLIFGGGPIGLMIADICHTVKECKSVTIIEPSVTRLNLISSLFPHFKLFNSVKDLDDKSEFDVIFTANSASECHKLSIDVAAKNARINFFGGLGTKELVAIDTNKIHYKQIMLTGTHGSRRSDFNTAFEYASYNIIDLDKYITVVYDLADINDAFNSAKDLNNLKIIVRGC